MTGPTWGRYRLIASPASRTGTVLSAEDTLLERRVGLLPVPETAAADAARLARIRQEVERAAGFVHPDVAGVYGLEEGGGRLLVTLEPAAGRGVDELLAAGGVPAATALEIALTVVEVLTAAKEAGIVHGSLHPGDVRLAADGAASVAGFGLHEVRRALAEEGAAPPPPAYRPPEAASGVLPDHRADLFALGRLVEELLAAAGLLAAETGGARAAALRGLRALLERCLASDPALRPSSAAELRPRLEAVRRELLREPEPEIEPVEPAAGESRRRTLPRWALPVAAGLLVAVAGWGLWRGLSRGERAAVPAPAAEAAPAVDTVAVAVLPFVSSRDPAEALLAVGFGREVGRLLGRRAGLSLIAAGSAATAAADHPDIAGLLAEPAVPGTAVAPGESGASPPGADPEPASVAAVAGRLGVGHLLAGSFEWQRDAEISRAEARVRLIRASDGEILWSETLEAFFGEVATLQDRVAEGAARRLDAEDRSGGRPLTASAGAYEAYLEGIGRAAAAGGPDSLRAAADSFERAADLDPGLLLAHVGQARALAALAARESGQGALAAARRALGAARRIDPGEPEVLRAAAELALAVGDPAAALAELEAALERLPDDPALLYRAALIDRRLGRWDEAIGRLAAARRGAPLDPDLGAELVRSLAWKRRFVEAAATADRLAKLLPEAVEPTLARVDLVLARSGAAARARSLLERMPEEARPDPRWQRRMLRLELWQGDYEAALARLPALGLEEAGEAIERGWILRYMGRSRAAAAAFERARDLLDDRLGTSPDDPWLAARLAQAYAGTGGGRLAARMGQRAVRQLPVTSDSVAGAELVELLARTYVLAGDHERAIDELTFLLELPSPVTLAVLQGDPVWGPLQGEPGFQELLELFAP